jgi:hypothetical protein
MRPLRLLPLLALSLLAQPLHARTLVVIVNPATHIQTMSRYEVIDVFMGRFRKLPSGGTALPIDLARDSPERGEFYRLLVHKDLAEISSYWARLVFSGQASPPFQAPNSRIALELVANNPNAIAYIDKAIVDHRVKVVLELTP